MKSYDVHKEMFEAPWIPSDARIPLHLARHSQSREVGTGSAFISARPPRPTRWFDNFLFGDWGWWYLVISGSCSPSAVKLRSSPEAITSGQRWRHMEGYRGMMVVRIGAAVVISISCCLCIPLYTSVYLCIPYMTYMTYMCAGLKWFESRLHPINSSGARLGSCKKSWNGI